MSYEFGSGGRVSAVYHLEKLHPQCILVRSTELCLSPVTPAGCHGIGTLYRFRWVVPR
jgi:hypothetical protein